MLGDPITEITIAMEVDYFQLNSAEYFVPVVVKIPGSELALAGSIHIFTRSAHGSFVVTWHAVRYQSASEGYSPLGENTFQVRLERNGSIEFRYGDVAEKDGIVGVFCGPASAGKLLDRIDLPPTPGLRPEVDLRRADGARPG